MACKRYLNKAVNREILIDDFVLINSVMTFYLTFSLQFFPSTLCVCHMNFMISSIIIYFSFTHQTVRAMKMLFDIILYF